MSSAGEPRDRGAPRRRRTTSSALRPPSWSCSTSAAAERFYVDLLGLGRERGAAPGTLYLRGWEEAAAPLARPAARARFAGPCGALSFRGARRGATSKPWPPTSLARGWRALVRRGGSSRARSLAGTCATRSASRSRSFLRDGASSTRQLQRFDLQARRAGPRAIDHVNLHTAGCRGDLPLLEVARLPLYRVHLHRRRRRAHHRRPGWARQAGRCTTSALTAGDGARACTTSASAVPDNHGRDARVAISWPPPARPPASSAAPGRHGVLERVSSSTCATPRVTASRLYACDYYTGRSRPQAPALVGRGMRGCRSFWGARAPDRLVHRVVPSCWAPTGRAVEGRGKPTWTSATRSAARLAAAHVSNGHPPLPVPVRGATTIPLRNHILGAGLAGETIHHRR